MLLGCLALTAYFVHHALNGSHGFEARSRLIARAVALDRKLVGLEATKARLKREVDLLAPDLPHPDIVEEIATGVLGMVFPGDRVLLDGPELRPRSAQNDGAAPGIRPRFH